MICYFACVFHLDSCNVHPWCHSRRGFLSFRRGSRVSLVRLVRRTAVRKTRKLASSRGERATGRTKESARATAGRSLHSFNPRTVNNRLFDISASRRVISYRSFTFPTLHVFVLLSVGDDTRPTDTRSDFRTASRNASTNALSCRSPTWHPSRAPRMRCECSTDAFAREREREQFPAIFSKRIPLDETIIKIAPRLTHAYVNNAARKDMCRPTFYSVLFSVVRFD